LETVFAEIRQSANFPTERLEGFALALGLFASANNLSDWDQPMDGLDVRKAGAEFWSRY